MDADALERGSTIGSTDYGEHFEERQFQHAKLGRAASFGGTEILAEVDTLENQSVAAAFESLSPDNLRDSRRCVRSTGAVEPSPRDPCVPKEQRRTPCAPSFSAHSAWSASQRFFRSERSNRRKKPSPNPRKTSKKSSFAAAKR